MTVKDDLGMKMVEERAAHSPAPLSALQGYRIVMIQGRDLSLTHVRDSLVGMPERTSSHNVESAWWSISRPCCAHFARPEADAKKKRAQPRLSARRFVQLHFRISPD